MGVSFNPSVATVPNPNANAEANPVGKGAHLSAAEQTALDAVVKETAAKKLDFGGDDDSQAAKRLHTKVSTDTPADSPTTEGALRWAQNVNGKDPEAVQVFLDRLQFADPKAYDYISNYLGIQARGETQFGTDADSQAAKRILRRSVGDPPADSATVDGALRWAQNVEPKDPAAVQKLLDKVQTTDPKAYDYISNYLGIQATGETWFGPDDDSQAAKRISRRSVGDPPADSATVDGALRWAQSVNAKDPAAVQNLLDKVQKTDPKAYDYISNYLGIQATGEMWFGPDPDAQAAKRLYRKSAGDPPADAETKQGALRWFSSVKDPKTANTYLAAVKVNDPAAYEYLSHYSSKVAGDQKQVAVAADGVANAKTSEEVSAAESDLNKSINTTISDLEARNVELAAIYKQNSTQRPIGRGNYEQAPANDEGKAAANEIQENNKLIDGFKKATLPTFIGTGAVAGPGGFGPTPPMGYVAPPDLPPGTDLKTATAHMTPAQANYLGWAIAQGILKKQVQIPPGDVQKWNTLAIWQKQNNDYYKTLSPTTEPPAANMGRVVTKDPIEFSKNITNNLVAKGSFNVFNQMPESAGKQFLDFFETASMFIPIPGLDAIGAAFKVGKEAVDGAVRGARGAFGAGAEGIAGASGRAARPLGGLETSGDIVIQQDSRASLAPKPDPTPEPKPTPTPAPAPPPPGLAALPRGGMREAELRPLMRSTAALMDATNAAKQAKQAALEAKAAAQRAAAATDPKVAQQEAAKAQHAADEANRHAKAGEKAFQTAWKHSIAPPGSGAETKATLRNNFLSVQHQADVAEKAAKEAGEAAGHAQVSSRAINTISEAKEAVATLDALTARLKKMKKQRGNLKELAAAREEVLNAQKMLAKRPHPSTPDDFARLENDTVVAEHVLSRAARLTHRINANPHPMVTTTRSVEGDVAYLNNPAAQPVARAGEEKIEWFGERSLFGPTNEPRLVDANQGALGSCWFDATLQDLAVKNPEVLKDGIREVGKGKGQYEVRLYDSHGNPHWVGVDAHFPSTGADLAHAGRGGKALWASLYEKAAAKMASFDKNVTFTSNDKTGYDAIDGDFTRNAADMLLGKDNIAVGYRFTNGDFHITQLNPHVSGNGKVESDIGPAIADRAIRNLINSNSGVADSLLTIGFSGTAPPGLMSKHAYAIRGLTQDKKNVVLINPHGGDPIEVPLSYLKTEGARIESFKVIK